MALQLPTNFQQDIQGRDTNIFPIVVLGYAKRNPTETSPIWTPPTVFMSTHSVALKYDLTFMLSDAHTYQFRPILLNVPSLKESIDIEKGRRYKISSMNIEISNLPYESRANEGYGEPDGTEGERFSDYISGDITGENIMLANKGGSLLNMECRVYWVSPGVEGFAPYDNPDYVSHPADAFMVYSGIVRKYTHDDEKAYLEVEDKTQYFLHKDLPLSSTNGLGADGRVPSKYKNKYIPMVYGNVGRSPLVTDSNYSSFKADNRDGVNFYNNTNEYGVVESPLYFDGDNGPINIESYESTYPPTVQFNYDNAPQIEISLPPATDSHTMAGSLAEDRTSSVSCLDRTPNYKIDLSNEIHLPNQTTYDIAGAATPDVTGMVHHITAINWYDPSGANLPNFAHVHVGPMIVTIPFGGSSYNYEILLLKMEINVAPTVEFTNHNIIGFILNGHNVTHLLPHENTYQSAEAIRAYPVGWNKDGTASSETLPAALGEWVDGIEGVSSEYNHFNHIVRTLETSIPDYSGWSDLRDKIDAIFNWPRLTTDGVGGGGNNPSADMAVESELILSTQHGGICLVDGEEYFITSLACDEAGGSWIPEEDVSHKGDIILFYGGGESEGLLTIDFRSIVTPNTDSDGFPILIDFDLRGYWNNIGLLRRYVATDFSFSKHNFYANVSGRPLIDGAGVINNAANQIFDIVKNELGYNKWDFIPAWAVDQTETEMSDTDAFGVDPSLANSSNLLATMADGSAYKTEYTVHEKINSKKLIENIASVTPLIPRFSNIGQFKINHIPLDGGLAWWNAGEASDNHHVKYDDVIDFSFSRTPIEEVFTRVEFKYKWDYGKKHFDKELFVDHPLNPNLPNLEAQRNYYRVSDLFSQYDPSTSDEPHPYDHHAGGYAYYGLDLDDAQSTLIIDDDRGKYIRDANTAHSYALWMLSWHCNQHLKMKVKLPLKYMNLEVSDIVDFNALLGDIKPYGIDYTNDGDIFGQDLYKNFIITATHKTHEWVEIECLQLHGFYTDTTLTMSAGCLDPNACNYAEDANTGCAGCCRYCDCSDPDCVEGDEACGGTNVLADNGKGGVCYTGYLSEEQLEFLESDDCGPFGTTCSWLGGEYDFCACVLDCELAGVQYDDCNVCGGNSVLNDDGTCNWGEEGSFFDCNCNCLGSAIMDECGVCGGGGIQENECDCDGNVLDCAEVCGGDAIIDDCGACAGEGGVEPGYTCPCDQDQLGNCCALDESDCHNLQGQYCSWLYGDEGANPEGHVGCYANDVQYICNSEGGDPGGSHQVGGWGFWETSIYENNNEPCCASENFAGPSGNDLVCWSYNCEGCPYEIAHPNEVHFKGGTSVGIFIKHFTGDTYASDSLHITDAPPSPDDNVLNIQGSWNIFPEHLTFNEDINKWVWYPSPQGQIRAMFNKFTGGENAFNPNSTEDFVENQVNNLEVIITPFGDLCAGCSPDLLFEKLHLGPELGVQQGNDYFTWQTGIDQSLYRYYINEITTFPASWDQWPSDVDGKFLFAISAEEGLHSSYERMMQVKVKYEDNYGNAFEHTQNVMFRYFGTGILGDVNNDGVCDLIDVLAVLHSCVLAHPESGTGEQWEGHSYENCLSFGENGAQADINGDGSHTVLDMVTLLNAVLDGHCPEG